MDTGDLMNDVTDRSGDRPDQNPSPTMADDVDLKSDTNGAATNADDEEDLHQLDGPEPEPDTALQPPPSPSTRPISSAFVSYPGAAVSGVARAIGTAARASWAWLASGIPGVEPNVELEELIDGWRQLDDDEVDKALNQQIVVAVMGRVSAGKSTLMKALLQIPPENTDVLQVSALSGTTREEHAFLWRFQGGKFILLDFPGFQEVYGRRSEEEERFKDTMSSFMKFGTIDVGIYVANGVPDASQKQDFDALSRYAGKVFLVRSKADELERYTPAGKEKVVRQWKEQFCVDQVYLTKVIGYDPDSVEYPNLDVAGVDELRRDMHEYLSTCKKGAVLDVFMNGLLNLTLSGTTYKFATVGLALLVAVLNKKR